MFFTKNLLGTPQRQRRFEFTPIGQASRSPQQTGQAPATTTSVRRLNDIKVVNTSIVDSDFDDTTENFTNTTGLQPQKPSVTNAGGKTSFHSKIVDNNAHSIREQQNELDRLQTENYNLKIEVATLTKFLKQTPEEQRELASQNVDLKQQFMESVRRIRDLEKTIAEQENAQGFEAQDHHQDQLEELEEKYMNIIRQKDEQLAQMPKSPVSDELIEKLEAIQSDNQSLRRQLESATAPEPVLARLAAVEEERDALQRQLVSVSRSSDAVHELKAANSKNAELREAFAKLQSQYSAVCRELEELKHAFDAKDSGSNALLRQIDAKNEELEHLSQEVQKWKAQYRNLSAEYEGFANTRNSSISKTRQELDQKDAEIASLNRNIKRLANDIDEKEAEIASLKAQIDQLTHASAHKVSDAYESQLEALRSKETRLMSENKRLKDELAQYQDQAYQVNVDASRLHNIQKENEELLDKLSYYEKEYTMAQEALENAESEVASLNHQKLRLDTQLADMEHENQELLNKVRNGYKADSGNEYELIEQIDDLNFKLRRLQKELEFEKSNKDMPKANSSFIETEYQKLSKERNKLKLVNDEHEIQIQEFQAKCSKLLAAVKDKETLIESLESHVRELSRQLKINSLSDAKPDELLKVKSDYEARIREIEAEYRRLEEDYRDQAAYYKSRMESFDFNSRDVSPFTALVEQQLEQARTLNNELTRKLTDALSNESRLTGEVGDLRSSIETANEKSSRLQREKTKLESLITSMETDAKILESENTRLETKTRNLTNELNTTLRHCTKLANKLNEIDIKGYQNHGKEEDLVRAKRNNAYLQKQIETLSLKLAMSRLSPPPSPGKDDEFNLLRHQLQYYKAVLHDINVRANDLSLMNNFIMKSIKNSNRSIKNDLVKLANCGIYPDYTAMDLERMKNQGKMSFKVVAQFVLAMVKMKRRLEKAQLRKVKMAELKNEIEREKISVLVR